MIKNDWKPVKDGKYPNEKVAVQVTYVGCNGQKHYCDAFAYIESGIWYWQLDDSVCTVTIVAWKENCKPY